MLDNNPDRIEIYKCWFLRIKGKPEYSEKNLSEQGQEPTTNSTHISSRVRESKLVHIGGSRRRVLSPLRHPSCPIPVFIFRNVEQTTSIALFFLKSSSVVRLNIFRSFIKGRQPEENLLSQTRRAVCAKTFSADKCLNRNKPRVR